MALGRKKYTKKSMRPRRRYTKYSRAGYKRTVSTVHKFKDTVQVASLTATAAGNAGGVMHFQISDLTNWASYQELFDLYKITGVKVKLVPKWSQSSSDEINSTSGAGTLPMLYMAVNRSPYALPPGGAGNVINDDGCKIIRLTRPITTYVSCPKPDITNEGGNIPMQFGVSKKFQPWLVTGGGSALSQENVSHYGIRWFIANGNGTHDVAVDVYLTYYFTMKEQN